MLTNKGVCDDNNRASDWSWPVAYDGGSPAVIDTPSGPRGAPMGRRTGTAKRPGFNRLQTFVERARGPPIRLRYEFNE